MPTSTQPGPFALLQHPQQQASHAPFHHAPPFASNNNESGSTLSLNEMDLVANANAAAMASAAGASNGGQQNGNSAADPRTVQVAIELALLQQGSSSTAHGGSFDLSPITANAAAAGPNIHPGLDPNNPLLHPYGISVHSNSIGGSLEDLKTRRSQNMTECVPVPTSEHVAEIVGRQGCKIKALRAKTNTYIKTPVRGEEPVFVVTGRKEDVALAKREILSAADHFSQIRASRSKNSGINSTLAFGQLVANQPGQTTVQVRVPYRVVGLVVGPKGATIKRIQQQTHTYIVTPSRDKEPVFEVTGLPDNVEAARKEIEAHIAIRTGTDGIGNIYGIGESSLDQENGMSHGNGFGFDSLGLTSTSRNSILNGDSAFSSLTSSVNGKGLTLQNLIDTNGGHFELNSHQNKLGINGHSNTSRSGHSSLVPWSNGGMDSHDSGIGNSPPFDPLGSSGSSKLMDNVTGTSNGTGLWRELDKAFGHFDINAESDPASSTLLNGLSMQTNKVRSSLDLGTLGRSSIADLVSGSNGSSHPGSSSSSTATPPNVLMSSGDTSPPNSLNYMSGHHRLVRASVSSEPNGIFSTESAAASVESMTATEAAAVKAAGDLAQFSSKMVLQETKSDSSDADPISSEKKLSY